MLLFFRKDLYFKSIESDRFHKVIAPKNRMRELIQFSYMFFEKNRTREIERLTKLVQYGNPSGNIRRSCEIKLSHDFRLNTLMLNCFCPDTHVCDYGFFANQP